LLTFLVIEDDISAAQRYATYVEQHDNQFKVVSIATSIEEARNSFAKSKPDVVISDIQLPGASGLDLLQEFRASGWTGQAVVVSGYDSFGYARQAIQSEVMDYLLKPVFQEDFNLLLERLKQRLRYCYFAASESTSEPGSAQSKPDYIVRTMHYIETHFASNMTLTQIASEACVSEPYLSSSFHKYCGMTVFAYIKQVRVNEARKLLLTSSMEVKEIAAAVGMQDLSYFYRCFKRHTGVTPKEFKETRCPVSR
jgi:two-component system, response regulator YesN